MADESGVLIRQQEGCFSRVEYLFHLTLLGLMTDSGLVLGCLHRLVLPVVAAAWLAVLPVFLAVVP